MMVEKCSACASHCGGDLLEATFVQHRCFAAHSSGVHAQDPVDPNRTGPTTLVPGAGSDVRPLTAGASPRNGVAVVVLAGQRQGQQPGPVMSDHRHRAILALTVVLFKKAPRSR